MNDAELTLLLKTGPARACCVPPGSQLALELAAERLGLAFYLADLGMASSKAGCLAELARTLELPAWFGHNWDALSDALTEPSLGERGLVIGLLQAERFACREHPGWLTLLDIMNDAAEHWAARGLPFWCVALSPSPALLSMPVLANH